MLPRTLRRNARPSRRTISPRPASAPAPLAQEVRRNRVFIAQRAFAGLVFVVLVVYATPQVEASRDPFQWDLMFITGTITLLAGLLATEGFHRRVESMLRRLVDRDIVGLDGRDLKGFLQDVDARAERAGLASGVAIGVISLAAVIAAHRHHAVLYALSLVGGFFVGYHLGRFASYGRIGGHLVREGLAIRPKPHHPDGVAGFRPVGELYFRQATLAAIPAAFLAAWSLVLPAWPRGSFYDYSTWRWPYLGLLSVALLAMAFAFLAPMWRFHRIMLASKEALIEDADKSSRRIGNLRAALATTTDKEERKALLEEIQRLVDDCEAIEEMAVWPVDPGTQRRFLNHNLVLALLPVAGNIAGLSESWRGFLATLVGA